MVSFIEFITEVKTISSSGREAARHVKKYILPFIGQEATHVVSSGVPGFNEGDKVTIHSHEEHNGKHYVHISKPGSSEKVRVPTSKLYKNKIQRNKGFEKENSLVNHLNKHGLMDGHGAGASGGNDFHLIDKRKPISKSDNGTGENVNKIQGEHKPGLLSEHKSSLKTSAFGQITLTRHPQTGKFHISDEARSKRPEFAAHVEKAMVTTHDGRRIRLLDHLNEQQPLGYEPKAGRSTATDIHGEEQDLSPAHAYMRDHHVSVVHIDGHGTFRAGESEHKDVHGLNLPKFEGKGRFRVRQKTPDPNKRTIQFSALSANKSPLDISTDEGAQSMKKILGHSDTNSSINNTVKAPTAPSVAIAKPKKSALPQEQKPKQGSEDWAAAAVKKQSQKQKPIWGSEDWAAVAGKKPRKTN
jgi:hypothetical protein